MKKSIWVRFCVILGLTLIAYIPAFIWMVDRWTEKDTYYSHGFLVPFIVGFLVWQKRKRFAENAIQPAVVAGWLLFSIGLIIHAFSALWRVYFSSGFSMLLVLAGIILLFFGSKHLRLLLFPVSFLIFMIPLPLVAIAQISFKLKVFAAQISTSVINAAGVAAVRDGSVIRTAHSYIMVEDPCSGIRSLIALIALGALMAYFSSVSKPRKTILFLSAIPIAIASNVFRIVSLCLVSEMYGSKYTQGLFHDTMGILVFVFAFAGLTLVSKLLE